MQLQGWRYYIVGEDQPTHKMMISAHGIPSGLRDAEIVVFTGGTDISPTMYNEFGVHARTQFPDKERDRVEKSIAMTSMDKGKVLVGICRGAQLLNVMNGGRLYQDVDGHCNSSHMLSYLDEGNNIQRIRQIGDHHQMMIPSNSGKMVGWCKESTRRSTPDRDYKREQEMTDPEIVIYPSTKTLCFQPHPEWGMESCKNLFFTCIKRTMIG